ncbi:hypothetical protein FHW84_001777 [Dyella sp. SG562]|uniref:ead/Ea22-like family protein n=1 Tax=Dyella sp. SG562 TaxID=2587017 RepID=UPI00142315D6|nr:ead/Ea22-like family protein [Dyella sp. SG562]NII73208.1 hypothetical protein [Dyella sp. SG562]
MTTSHEHLRDVAEKATPGPWSRLSGKLRPQFSLRINEIHGPDHECLIRWNGFDGIDTNKRQADANAKFIAAFNPATAIAMLDELAALRKENEALRACLSDVTECLDQHGGAYCGLRDEGDDHYIGEARKLLAARASIGDSHER